MLFVVNQFKAEKSIASSIPESLVCELKLNSDLIIFSNYIMTDRVQKKGEQKLHYTFKHCKNKRSFDIINDISEYVTLVQLFGHGW